MKKNKIIGIIIFSLFMVGLASGVYYYNNVRCVLDGESVCLNKELESFEVEEDTDILVQVENEALGNYLVDTWNELHPENKNAIRYDVKEVLTLQELADGFPYDILLTKQSNVSYFMSQLRDLGKSMDEIVGSRIPSQLQDAINLQGYYFVQNSIDGWYFVYNETLLEEMGFNMEPDREYGLPESLSSWEQIFANKDKILKQANYLFPLTFTDQNSFYPFLTGGRWTLNFTNLGSEPGFDSREFTEGLELIELFAKNEFYNVEDASNQEKNLLPWLYEEAFYNRESPFTMLHSSMQFDSYKEKTNDVYRIAPFPKFKDHHLAPLSEINGYMVSYELDYPSAAAEVLRILRTPQALEVYESADGKIPIYSRNHFDELNFDDEMMRNILAYNYHDAPSVLALDNNPFVLTRTLYDDIDFMNIFKRFYLGDIDIEETQKQVVEKVDAWIEEHDGKGEE